MAMQIKAWMTSTFQFKLFLSFSKRLGGFFQSNWHLLVLNGHGSLVKLEAIK
jgi:hypothetical protein